MNGGGAKKGVENVDPKISEGLDAFRFFLRGMEPNNIRNILNVIENFSYYSINSNKDLEKSAARKDVAEDNKIILKSGGEMDRLHDGGYLQEFPRFSVTIRPRGCGHVARVDTK